MIDYIAKFADQATAMADATFVAQVVGGDWLRDHCTPITVWRNSQDVGGVHTPLAGFFVLISLNNIVPALRDHAAIQLVIDSDKAAARQAGMVIKSNVSGAILQDIRLQPIFAGRDYPFGGLS